MKKILLIINGLNGKQFLNRIMKDLSSSNEYYVVYYEDDILPEKKSDTFKFFKFDPTSFVKLSLLLKSENFFQITIVLPNKTNVEEVVKNIRMVKKSIPIVVMDKWELDFKDKDIIKVNINDVIVNRLIHTLPNIPVIAQNIGLGHGEIMEISVPFTSSYVYRHISSIEQRDWKIVSIYRNNKMIIARDTLMIQPNDILLTVGEPEVLKNVYRVIKKEIGQFPSPFGSNIYVLIDMRYDTFESINRILESTKYLHSKLKNKKLIVKVLHPNSIETLNYIKNYDENITICIDYKTEKLKELLTVDNRSYNIGLILVSNLVFDKVSIRENLYNTQLPILKIGDKNINTLKESIVILSKNRDLEKISSAIFDVSSQLNLNINILDLDPEGDFKEKSIEYFKNLSRIFSKNINIVSHKANPIREVRKMDNFLQFIPFTSDIAKSNLFSIFSNDIEKLYFKLDDYNQLFIPVSI